MTIWVLAFIMQTSLWSSSSNYHNRLNLIDAEHPYFIKLRSTSLATWLPMRRWEFMNVVSKSCLCLFFLGNGPRVGNEQRDSMGPVEQWYKNSFDKARFHFLGAEDVRWLGAGLSTKRDNKVVPVPRWETRAEKGNLVARIRTKNDVVGIEQDDKVGKRWDNQAGKRRDNNGVGNPKIDNKRVVGPTAGARQERDDNRIGLLEQNNERAA